MSEILREIQDERGKLETYLKQYKATYYRLLKDYMKENNLDKEVVIQYPTYPTKGILKIEEGASNDNPLVIAFYFKGEDGEYSRKGIRRYTIHELTARFKPAPKEGEQ